MAQVIDSFTTPTGAEDHAAVSDTYWNSQTFTASASYTITSVKLKLFKDTVLAPGTITVSIRATSSDLPSGADLASGTTDGDTLGTSYPGEWREITLTEYSIVKGTKYAIVVRTAGSGNYPLRWVGDDSSPAYTGGAQCYSTNSGVDWTENTGRDFTFQTLGGMTPPTDKIYSKTLVAIGGNEVWYESSAGTIDTELTDANGDVNVSKPLMAVEAFQKVFVVNDTNLKIIDFGNTKISDDNGFTNKPSRGTIVYQNGTDAAQMVVDYINSTDKVMYGTVIAGTFEATTAITSSAIVGEGYTILPSPAAPISGPHWYDWTVYDGDVATYGVMPSQATIACLYNGRVVLAGDPNYPHQWYMPKALNPFMFLYDDSDPLTAIRGGNADVAEIGDIITALISPKDDLLIIGCASSVWVIVGDPAHHGQLGNLTRDTGIWGSRAWCLDGKGGFYFLGEDGLYKSTIAEMVSVPENISYSSLPTLMDDLALNKSLHRVILTYDADNNGVRVSKTLLSDGTNTNYWYDLSTGGFFPESYPTTQAIFSSYKYNATDRTYAKLLVGCNDGYIREFDPDTKNDDGTAIDSYFTLGPIALGGSPVVEGSIGPMDIVLGGGASNGSETDSDDADYKVFVADTAANLIEKLTANGTPVYAGTMTGPGRRRGSRRTQSARGVYGGVRIGNDTAGEAFIFESLDIKQKPKGRSK